jgi:UPF0755 protein
VPREYGAEAFILLQLNTFKERFNPRYQEAIRTVSTSTPAGRMLTPIEIVTLASIVEREAQVPEERELIAGLFLRRMAFDMPLAADPTIQYALVPPGSPAPFVGYWKRDLLAHDLQVPSPYNTYTRTGLPPGPIANPGLASLAAVLRPAQTNALYFVAKPDGSHAFATTFEEHQANINLYRR